MQAFRRAECNEPATTLKLCGLDPDAQYEFTQFDVAGTTTLSGHDLMNTGLSVSLPDRPGAAVFTYRHVLVCPGLAESLQTITDQELMDYVQHLADDAMEGRKTNTPGGTAAGDYLAAGAEGPGLASGSTRRTSTSRTADDGCRNVLGLLKGSDPAVAEETVIVGAHYDHVGVRQRGGDDPPSSKSSTEPTTTRAAWRASWKSPKP